MNPLISIIIPVYNVKQYLDQCMDSVLQQTYSALEIILVDDGSTDGSSELCDKYAEKDSRVRVIHKENGGLSSARNAALEICTGEYVCFIDSDDYVSRSLVERSIASLKETNADVCIFAHYTTDGERNTEHLLPLEKSFYDKKEILEEIIPLFIGENEDGKILHGFVCRQVFRRSAIGNLRFKSEREYYAEDIVFDLEFYKTATSLCVVREPLYYYRCVPTSLTNGYREKLFHKFYTLLVFMNEYVEENGIVDCEIRILKRAFRCAIGGCLNVKKASALTKKQKKAEIREIAEDSYVKTSLQKLRFSNIKERIFAILLKMKAAGLILALI